MSCKEKWYVINWTIENFSYWNVQVHGDSIPSPRSDNDVLYRRLILFPRGVGGNGRNLVVRIRGDGEAKTEQFQGDLSFFGPDEFLLCRQQIGKVKNENELPDGPEHEAVFSLLRKNEGKDQLTLRCRLKSEYNVVYHFHTIIDVLNMSMNIPAKIIADIPSREEEIFVLNYPHNDCVSGINVHLSKELENRDFVRWAIRPLTVSDSLFLDWTVSVFNCNGEPVRSHGQRFEFHNNHKFTFDDSLSLEEVIKNYSLRFNFSLYLGNHVKSYGYHSFNSKFNPADFKLSSINTSSNDFRLMISSPLEESSSKSLKAVASKQTMTDPSEDPVVCLPPENIPAENSPDIVAAEDEKTVLSRELMYLYQDQDFSDFEIRCGEVSFAAHKNILSARSPVFKTMLLSDMTEAASGSVEVVDLDVPTLSRFLAFLYTGTVDELQCEDSLRLYYAASKYQVPTLKKVCASVMRSSVSISNVCDILSLADKHQDEELTVVARDFILKNYNQVLKSEEWKSFMSTDPITLLKTVTYFAEQDCVGKTNAD